VSVAEAAPAETGLEAGGYAKGVAIAVVTQNQDPDGMCRVKVRYPWYDKKRESYWARLATPMAGKDRGLVLIPEVGDEVIVGFEREDLRFPVVLGSAHNGKDSSPFTNSDGKNDVRQLKSRSGHFIRFNDGSQGSVELSLKDGKRVLIDQNGLTLEDEKGNHVKIDSGSGAIEINASGKLTIKAASVSIEATGTLDIKASGTLSARGSVINLN
jgi:uncharacterized protein involved in type VI secretion and phage assembly